MGVAPAGSNAGIVDEKLRFEIVGGVDDKIVCRHQGGNIVGGNPKRMAFHPDIRIQRFQRRLGGRSL